MTPYSWLHTVYVENTVDHRTKTKLTNYLVIYAVTRLVENLVPHFVTGLRLYVHIQ